MTECGLFCVLRFWENNCRSSKVVPPRTNSPPTTVPLTIPTRVPDRGPEAFANATGDSDAVGVLLVLSEEEKAEDRLAVFPDWRFVLDGTDELESDTAIFDGLGDVVCRVFEGALASGTSFVGDSVCVVDVSSSFLLPYDMI